MSFDGSRFAIGADRNDGNGSDSGHVRVFDYISFGGWTKDGFDIDGEAANDNSGSSVSMSLDGSRVVIGVNYNDGNGNNSGHVSVFDYSSSGGWTKVASDIDWGTAVNNLGSSVSMSFDGSRVAIGAKVNDGNGSDSGHVRVFDYRSSGGLTLVVSDIDGEAAYDLSGSSVSMFLDGSRVVIGAKHNDSNRIYSGHVRVFDYSSSGG